MIRVVVAEDMQILRDTLAAVLSLEEDIEVAARVHDGDAIVREVLPRQPHVALVDIDMRALTASGYRAVACAVSAVPAGELVDAVRRVAVGQQVMDPQVALAALEVPDNLLSPREAEVLRRFAGGAAQPRSPLRCSCPMAQCGITWLLP